jgi:hypothetical protein
MTPTLQAGKRRWRRLISAGGIALVAILSFAYGVGVGVRHWPPFALLKKLTSPPPDAASDLTRAAEEAAARIALLAQNEAGRSKSEQARFAREFVYDHSIHAIDEEHAQYAWDTSTVLLMLHNHCLTRQRPPHLSCGPRALALQAILDALGIENRAVHVFSGDYDEIRSHTFVEVLDENSGRWVIHDPDFDVAYVDTRAGRQVSLLRLVFNDLESVLPVSRRGRGWEINEVDHLKAHYFQAAKYDVRAGDCDVLVMNTDRFPVAKRFSGNGGVTFREFSEQSYRRPAFLLNNTVSGPQVESQRMGKSPSG